MGLVALALFQGVCVWVFDHIRLKIRSRAEIRVWVDGQLFEDFARYFHVLQSQALNVDFSRFDPSPDNVSASPLHELVEYDEAYAEDQNAP